MISRCIFLVFGLLAISANAQLGGVNCSTLGYTTVKDLQLCNVYCNTHRCQDTPTSPSCPHIAQAITKDPPTNPGQDTIPCTSEPCPDSSWSEVFCPDGVTRDIYNSCPGSTCTSHPVINNFCEVCGVVGSQPCKGCDGERFCIPPAVFDVFSEQCA
jgi:hypothetical protein